MISSNVKRIYVSRLRFSSCGIDHNTSNARRAQNSIGEEVSVDEQSSFHLSAVQRPTPKFSELTSNSTLATETTMIEEVSLEGRQIRIEPKNRRINDTEREECEKAEDEKGSISDENTTQSEIDDVQKTSSKKCNTKRIHIRNKQQLTYSA
mmetsp:Transcript_27386/g.38216  ORF Transcript_27386/g.38216 Transcript_27386/m.38216 type:complete len:151 (+) Transcript_27386:704-1156(+)